MADRRNVRKFKEANGNNTSPIFYFYLFTFMSILFLGFLLWMFGVDFGFVRFGGIITMGNALWIFMGALVVEYFVDVWYALNLYKRFKIPSGYAFIPFLNSCKVWSKLWQSISFALLGLIALATVVITTPIVAVVAPRLIMESASWASLTIILALVGVFIVRGIVTSKFKIELINKYTKLVGQGASPAMGFFKSILYFIPIIRIVLLIEDKTFINNVFGTIEKSRRIDRGAL